MSAPSALKIHTEAGVAEDGFLPPHPMQPAPRSWTGDVRHLGRLADATLGNTRDVWVYLPRSYARGTRRYPVAYFHDGQNVFDTATAFASVEWQADETLEQLVSRHEIREVIAVAVGNTPLRIDEYTPVTDPRQAGGGRAGDYVHFLVHELKPRIDAAFRTRPGRADTALIGSSLGGLVSLYAGIAASDVFGRIGALSPVFDWGGYDIEWRYATAPLSQLPMRLWIDMGTAEDSVTVPGGTLSRLVLDVRRFRAVVERRGYTPGLTLDGEETTGALHNEAAWAERLPRVLRFLFSNIPGR